jgi:hypothetical protein
VVVALALIKKKDDLAFDAPEFSVAICCDSLNSLDARVIKADPDAALKLETFTQILVKLVDDVSLYPMYEELRRGEDFKSTYMDVP